jgi:hypothetical protein
MPACAGMTNQSEFLQVNTLTQNYEIIPRIASENLKQMLVNQCFILFLI